MLTQRTGLKGGRERKPGARPTYRPVVSIANTDYRLFVALRDRIGCGQVYEHKVSNTAKSYNPRKVQQWTWRLNVAQIREHLPLCLDYLVLKQEQAMLLLEACEIKSVLTPIKGQPFPPVGWEDMVHRLDEIYATIREANTRGRVVLPPGGDSK